MTYNHKKCHNYCGNFSFYNTRTFQLIWVFGKSTKEFSNIHVLGTFGTTTCIKAQRRRAIFAIVMKVFIVFEAETMEYSMEFAFI